LRDLKPENLLVTNEEEIKLADFGLARSIRSKPPFTSYVSTRWYRAPELLLKSVHYNSAVDLWAFGAILVELFTLRPLFPGTSQIDQLFKVCATLGTPKSDEWTEGHQLAFNMNFHFPNCSQVDLAKIIPHAPVDAVKFVRSLLKWNPSARLSTTKCLTNSWLKVVSSSVEKSNIKKETKTRAKSTNDTIDNLLIGNLQYTHNKPKHSSMKIKSDKDIDLEELLAFRPNNDIQIDKKPSSKNIDSKLGVDLTQLLTTPPKTRLPADLDFLLSSE